MKSEKWGLPLIFTFHFSLFIFSERKSFYICTRNIWASNRVRGCNQAGIAQLVEHDLAKVGVASSSLVSRSTKVLKK